MACLPLVVAFASTLVDGRRAFKRHGRRGCDNRRVTASSTRAPRITAVLREEERVTPLELFFDLALTQCTALMAASPTWAGLARGLLVLAALWWAWTAYAWLTSVVDPEEGVVRLAMFAAMAAFLVVALGVAAGIVCCSPAPTPSCAPGSSCSTWSRAATIPDCAAP